MIMITKSLQVQIGLSFTAGLNLMIAGLTMSWTSAALPQLLKGDRGISISTEQGAWITSLLSVGILISSFYVRFAIDRIGRKYTLLSSSPPFILSWIILRFGNEIWHFYFGRIIAGIGFGIATGSVSIYMGEIADRVFRGGLATVPKFMLNYGSFLTYSIGPFTSYNVALYCYGAFSLFALVMGALLLPESPFYHVKNGDIDKAEMVMMKVRATSEKKIVKEELGDIQKIVNEDMIKKSSIKELLTSPLYRKSIIIFTALKVLQNMAGFTAIGAYVQSIFDAAKTGLASSYASIIYGVMQLFGVIISSLLVDKFGRRPMLILSLSGIIVSLSAIGAYFFVQDYLMYVEELKSVSFLPLLAIIVYCISYSCGLGPITFILESELFPTNVKGAAVSVGIAAAAVSSVCGIKIFQELSDAFGIYSAMWFFAGSSLIGLIIPVCVLPETKGKTFDQIQGKLKKNIKRKAGPV